MLNDAVNVATRFLDNSTINPNATITFTALSDNVTLVEDSVGNMIPDESSTTLVTIQCYLRQVQRPSADVQLGVNLDSEYFEGRLVNPKTYDLPLRSLSPITVTVNGRTGTLMSLIHQESPSSVQLEIAAKLGQRIKCYVQFPQ